MADKQYKPIPVLDTLEAVVELYKSTQNAEQPHKPIRDWLIHCFQNTDVNPPNFATKDFLLALRFLYSYRGSKDTFGSYRREIERLLQWSWFVSKQSILKHKRQDIEAFIEFCIKPYKRWISLKKATRFQTINGEKIPHPGWRPFEAQISKQDRKEGREPTKDDYHLSQQGMKRNPGRNEAPSPRIALRSMPGYDFTTAFSPSKGSG